MNHGSLFSGIGGFDLAAEWMGWNNIFNCEWEEFPRKVLKHHFPNAEQHEDIREFDATTYAGRIDILSGGFPCQPYSVAGLRKGKQDERHLWPEMLRIIRECQPRWVVGENVRGLVNWSEGLVFEEVCTDLEACGYSVQPFILPACAVNAPHRRDRVWFVAHSDNERKERTPRRDASESRDERIQERDEVQQPHESNSLRKYATNTENSGRRGRSREEREDRREGVLSRECEGRTMGGEVEGCGGIGNVSNSHGASGTSECINRQRQGEFVRRSSDTIPDRWEEFPTVPPVCGGDDGLPKELDGITFSKWRKESIKAYGNAIVPQVAFRIFEAIQDYEKRTKSTPPR